VTGRKVYLVGMPGSGKSSVGEALAGLLDLRFVDLDREVEAAAGSTVEEVFSNGGEPRFRELESRSLLRVAGGPAAVVACGGGVVLREANRDLLRSTGTVVYLSAPLAALRERLAPFPSRPLIRSPADLEALFREREPSYRSVAHHEIDATGAAEDVARAVREVLP
jgi:shikimate kinase